MNGLYVIICPYGRSVSLRLTFFFLVSHSWPTLQSSQQSVAETWSRKGSKTKNLSPWYHKWSKMITTVQCNESVDDCTWENKKKPILRLKLRPQEHTADTDTHAHKSSSASRLIVLSGVNETKIFASVKSFVEEWKENGHSRVSAMKHEIDSLTTLSGNSSPLLNASLMAALYEAHDVPHELQHDAFSEEFQMRWRQQIDVMIARARAQPCTTFTLQFLFLHAAKRLTCPTGRALMQIAAHGSSDVSTLILNFVPAAMIQDFGICNHLRSLHDNNTLVTYLTPVLYTNPCPIYTLSWDRPFKSPSWWKWRTHCFLGILVVLTAVVPISTAAAIAAIAAAAVLCQYR